MKTTTRFNYIKTLAILTQLCLNVNPYRFHATHTHTHERNRHATPGSPGATEKLFLESF